MTKENHTNYISDFDFYNSANYMPEIFQNWYEHILNTYYLLKPFEQFMPTHYWYFRDTNIYPIEMEPKRNGTIDDVINVIKKGTVIAKPCMGGHGHGVYKITYAKGTFEINQKIMDESEVRSLLKNLNDYIIEEFAIPHSVFQKKCGEDAFAVIRVSTVYSEREGPQVTGAVIRLGSKKAGVVPDYGGTISCGINIQTGELFDPKYRYGSGNLIFHNDIDIHPDTGEKLVGVLVPNWGQLLKLVKKLLDMYL